MKIRASLAVAALALLGACAPVSFAGGPGLHLSVGYRSGFQLSQCSGLAAYSPEATRMGVRSAAIQANAIRNQITQIQHRVSTGYFIRPLSTEGWKRVASGEC
jgi:hypothetical protein